MRTRDVSEISAIHCARLSGLLTELGPLAAAQIYKGYLASPACVAFVAEEHGAITGFVLGATRPDVMRKDALRARGVRVLSATLLAALRKPRLFPWLMDTSAPFDLARPELTYIAAKEPGTGVGKALIAAFAEAVPRYELSVEVSNERAVRFYEARGLRLVSTYEQFGAKYRRYGTEG